MTNYEKDIKFLMGTSLEVVELNNGYQKDMKSGEMEKLNLGQYYLD